MSARTKRTSAFVIIHAAKVTRLYDLRFMPEENYGIRSL